MEPGQHREIGSKIIDHIWKSKKEEHTFIDLTDKIGKKIFGRKADKWGYRDIEFVLDKLLKTKLLERTGSDPVNLTVFKKTEKFEDIARDREAFLKEHFPD